MATVGGPSHGAPARLNNEPINIAPMRRMIMTEPVPTTYSPTWSDDSRTSPPRVGDERETLVTFLDWHRATFELKCRGLRSDQLSERTVPPSSLSLHGVLRHLAGVEGWWFARQFAGQSSWLSLRWLLVHMIAEYARHNGQSDLLRERIDGATGV
jgi:hypothetical protein